MAAPGAGVDLNVALTEILTRFGSVRIRDIGLRYAKLGRLGGGAFGTTFKVRPKTPSGAVDLTAPCSVMKEITRARVLRANSEQSVQHIAAELAVTGLVAPGSPYLNKRTGLYHDDENIYILLELCGGPRPDVATRVAHVIAKRKPARLPEFDDIMAELKAKAVAAGVDPNDEEAFGDFVDRKDFVIAGQPRSHIDNLAIQCGLRKIDEGNFAEMPVGDTLFNVIVAPRVLSDEHNRIITRQLLLGFGYLHECFVVNRDVKPENIMISVLRRAELQRDAATGKVSGAVFYEKYHAHVIDFGLAKVMTLATDRLHTSPGAFIDGQHGAAVAANANAAAAAPAVVAAPAPAPVVAQVDDEDDDPFAPERVNNMAPAVNAAAELARRRAGEFNIVSTNCGSHAYLSLETTNGILAAIRGHQPRWNTSVETLPLLDVWAVGACQFAVANGTPPYKYEEGAGYRRLSSEEKLRQIRDAILRGLQFRSTSSAEARRFSQKLMDTNIATRPSAAAALLDPYVNHAFTTVRTEIHASGAGNRTQMLRDLPAGVAGAVLRDVAAASRNDFPQFMMMGTVKAAFPPVRAAAAPAENNQNGGGGGGGAAAAATEAAAADAQNADNQGDVAALRAHGAALRGVRLQEEGVDEEKEHQQHQQQHEQK